MAVFQEYGLYVRSIGELWGSEVNASADEGIGADEDIGVDANIGVLSGTSVVGWGCYQL